MADFSKYSTPHPEWVSLFSSLPPIVPRAAFTLEQTLQLRATTNKGREEASKAVFEPLREKLVVRDHTITTRDGYPLQARSYRAKGVSEDEVLPVYVHFHGGGFVFGTLDSEDASCARIVLSLAAKNQPIVVLNVNYRHTPEWKYPVAWDDAVDAFVWTHKNASTLNIDTSKVILGGISAGARLVSSLALQHALGTAPELAGLQYPAGQLLFIPSYIHQDCHSRYFAKFSTPSVASTEALKDAPIIPAQTLRWFTDLLEVPEPKAGDLKLNPGNITTEQLKRLSEEGKLPPTVSGIAGFDPLRDEGLLFAKDLTDAGVPTRSHVFPGVPHGFRRFGGKLSACQKWDRATDEGILWCLGSPEASEKFQILEE